MHLIYEIWVFLDFMHFSTQFHNCLCTWNLSTFLCSETIQALQIFFGYFFFQIPDEKLIWPEMLRKGMKHTPLSSFTKTVFSFFFKE